MAVEARAGDETISFPKVPRGSDEAILGDDTRDNRTLVELRASGPAVRVAED